MSFKWFLDRISHLTVDEDLWHVFLFLFEQYFCIQKRLVLITNLPEFHNDGYAEADISRLLQTFGFQYEDTHLYVIPQSRMVSCETPALESDFKSWKPTLKKQKSFLLIL